MFILFNYWSDGSDPTGIVKDTKNWCKDLDTSTKYPWLNSDYNYKNTNYKEYVYIPPDDNILISLLFSFLSIKFMKYIYSLD